MGILQPRPGSSARDCMYEPDAVSTAPDAGCGVTVGAAGYPFPVWPGASSGYFTTSINPYSAASSGLIQ